MNHRKTPRLKPLLDAVPPGFMVDTRWLRARGLDSKSIHDYVARGWLERVVRGVYRRPVPEGTPGESEESWAITLLSLQWLMKYALHLGGESALDMTGYAHYLSLGGRPRVQFYGEAPSWLKRLPMQTEIVVRRCTLFGDNPIGIDVAAFGAAGTRPTVKRVALAPQDVVHLNAPSSRPSKSYRGIRPSRTLTRSSRGSCRSDPNNSRHY